MVITTNAAPSTANTPNCSCKENTSFTIGSVKITFADLVKKVYFPASGEKLSDGKVFRGGDPPRKGPTLR
jgi:hypothetical protein